MANNVVYSAEAVSGNNVSVTKNLDFPVDIMVLTGRASIRNDSGPVAIGRTRFDSSRSALARVAQQEYDLDGDGIKDVVRLGAWEEQGAGSQIFNINAETPTVQGVWLSSVHGALQTPPENIPPDLTRLPDWSADFDDRALLSEISVDDLGDTDLYVFREADGSLLMERKGVDENERNIGVDAEQGEFAYTLRMVGSRGRLTGGTVGDGDDAEFRQWQMEEGVVSADSSLYRREANHLRPGEMVRLIAINRASGYLGSLSVELQSAASGSDDLEMSFNADDIQLLPPNLKVWAERQSRTELGMTQGEINKYLVGSEGAGMSNDLFIAIYMEWLDVDGTPLPTALADYGYTARLARIVSENTLESVDSIDSIAIKPGRQMALIRLPESGVAPSNLTIGEETQYYAGNEHFYVQVSGQPHTREADFSSSGQAQMLAHRPTRFVPVLAPVFDEETTNLSIKTWNSLRESNPDLNRPEPVYQWSYRPEYQFSVYDLRMREINRQDVLGETQNILSLEQPLISNSDEVIQLLYDLTGPSADGSSLDTLDAYSYVENKELVFAFGEQEISATVNGDGQIVFDDVSQLSSLSAEDYLSFRLYTNNDPGNVLWEYAFGFPVLRVDLNRDGKITRQAKDRVSPKKPFRFWINDDDDNGEIANGLSDVPGTEFVIEPTTVTSPDYLANTVGGASDLVDYFPLGLDIQPAFNAYPPARGYSYLLRHQDEAFNFIYTNLAWSDADRHLKEFTDTGFGPSFDSPADKADKLKITAEGIPLSEEFLDHIKDRDETGLLLLDIRKATTQPLELVVKKNDKTVLVIQLPVEASGVEDMFRHVNVVPVVVNKDGQPLRAAEVASRTSVPMNYPNNYTSDKWFVFIHGYNVTQQAARGWQAETFKRLHQLGSNARFVGVTWHGDTSVDYHQAVKQAFQTGSELSKHLQFVSGDVTVAAHSLGNMMTSHAITAGGFMPTRYYMIDAAVPIEAYDSGQKTDAKGTDMQLHMTEDSWKPYLAAGGTKLFADGWHSLFTDARAKITWADQFRTVLGLETYNFHSTGEEVMENPGSSETVNGSLSDMTWELMKTAVGRGELGRHAWVAQEIAKGSESPFLLLPMGVQHGGWGYNRLYGQLAGEPLLWATLEPAEAMVLSEEMLRAEPFFRRFQETDDLFDYNGALLYGPDQDDTANTEAAKPGTQYKLLAEAIPSRSFGVAANSVDDLTELFNLDMMNLKNQGRWPDKRPLRTGSPTEREWWHSDFREVALLYTLPMWQTMVQRGGLEECAGC